MVKSDKFYFFRFYINANRKENQNMELRSLTAASKAKPAFGAIDFEAAKDVIKKLPTKDIESFTELVKKQKDNSCVDVVLIGIGEKKLCANVADTASKSIDDFQCKSYKQRFFESPINFVKRCCGYADKRMNELEELQKKQELLNNLDKI